MASKATLIQKLIADLDVVLPNIMAVTVLIASQKVNTDNIIEAYALLKKQKATLQKVK